MRNGDSPANLIDLLQTRASHSPDFPVQTFLADGERVEDALIYRALDRRARCIAAVLEDAGLSGETALLLYPPGPGFVAAFWGCLYAGVVAVPAYPPKMNRSFGRLRAIARDARAAAVLSLDALLGDVRERLNQEQDVSVRCWFATDTLADHSASWRRPLVGPETLAFLQYTSGSTGDPKGVMVTHGNILHNCECLRLACGVGPETTSVCWLPSFHDMGLLTGIILPMYAGFGNYLMPPAAFLQQPVRWLRAISRFRASYSGAPNSAYELCLRMVSPEQCHDLDLSCWTSAFNAAEPVRAATLRRFAERFAPYGFRPESWLPGYGMAEATLVVSCGPPGKGSALLQVQSNELQHDRIVEIDEDQPASTTLAASGSTVLDADVRIVHPERRTLCGPGEIGELWVRSPSVTQGYFGRPELTASVFGARLADTGEGPFLRTGDQGYIRDGHVFVTARLKDLIIVQGRNFYPQDIEATVEQSHPALNPGAAVAFSLDLGLEERLVVAVEVRREARRGIVAEEVFDAIRKSVAEEHELHVHAIALLKPSTVPKTSSGKIQRRPCREAYSRGELETIAIWQAPLEHASEAPAGPQHTSEAIEAWVRGQIARQTGIAAEQIDLRQPFTTYGFGSLEAVSFAGQLETWLGRSVPPTLLYDQPSILAVVNWASNATSSHSVATPDRAPTSDRAAVAIVGVGCRFPGASNPNAFWRILKDGTDCVTRVPRGRFGSGAALDDARLAWGGFLDQVDGFDAGFFGLTPREAEQMDPQQRLLVEVAWETVENAGWDARRLSGTPTGVFVGISGNEYLRLMAAEAEGLDAYAGTGNASSIAANRLSYILDLRGPSIAVDTACSSSLAAVHLACRSLRAGECRTALAGGVNLILSPDISRVFAQAKMLAADGRCKTFAKGADGYVRGEGCGMVLLKRLSDAVADGDNILAVIRGSAMNQDGRSNGLTAPNGPAQEAVIRAAVADASVQPRDIDYVEAHGTGTELGDPIEVQALGTALGAGRPADHPLQIGSVKTNIGHLEAAAGIAGLIKVVLSLKAGEIPTNLHFVEPNPYIPWDRLPIKVATTRMPWAVSGRPRLAGVSSFGFGGTNAHIVVEEAPSSASPLPSVGQARPVHVLALSAQSESALSRRREDLAEYLSENTGAPLPDVCFTCAAGRSHFEHRLAVVVRDPAEAAALLKADRQASSHPAVIAGKCSRSAPLKVAFLFTGQGSQYAGMGRLLFETQPTFRRALLRCDAAFRECRDRSLVELLYENDPEATGLLDRTFYAQPALFALECSLAELWSAWGVRPAAVLGHSLGEYTAACVAGVFTLEDGLRLVAERARIMDEAPGHGSMIAVFAGRQQVNALLAAAESGGREGRSSKLSIAAINSEREIVVSGDAAALDRLTSLLKKEGLTWHALQVSHAFHSPLMEPILPAFREAAGRVAFAPPRVPVVSNLFGEIVRDGRIGQADYWVRHVREPVQFAAGLRSLIDEGVTAFVELGPHAVLSSLGQRATPREDLLWLPSLRRGADDWSTLAQSLARLYAAGGEIDWRGFDRDYPRRTVSLPTYPFERQRYWFKRRDGKMPDGPALAKDADRWLYELRWQPAQPQPGIVSAAFLEGAEDRSAPLRRRLNESVGRDIRPDEDRLLEELEARCLDYVLAALAELGVAFTVHERIDVNALATRLGIEPRHHRLFGRLFAMLAEAGYLRKADADWRVERWPAQTPLAGNRSPSAGSSVLADVLAQCGPHLARVLRGQVDPLQLLFPENSQTSAERLYRDAPGAKVLNTLVGDLIAQAVLKAPPGRMVRVLELGAGTGGTTASVLPQLTPDRVAYTFTDVSPFFLSLARKRFADHAFVNVAALDISADPSDQGFEAGGYDVILAANVLHATADLRRSLTHVRSLLAPGGVLVLLEGTSPRRSLDLTFGLLDGWWAFKDADLRPDYPLLSCERWSQLLAGCGFKETAILPGPDEPVPGLADQRVIVAQAPAQAPVEKNHSIAEGTWLLCTDTGGFGQRLADQLTQRGAAGVRIVDPAHLREAIDETAGGTSAVRGVVFLDPLDATRDSDPAREAAVILSRALELVQTIAKKNPAPKVWFVTRGAQRVAGESGPTCLAGAGLSGLGQVAGIEHPEIWGGMVDLDPRADCEQAATLAELLLSEGHDTSIAVRGGLALAPRLVKAARSGPAISFDPEASYLITGGLGAAGLVTARWMVSQGAQHLVLLGRRKLPPREQWDSLPPQDAASQQVQSVRELESLGAEVQTLSADVGDRESLREALGALHRGARQLRGVIHAAGVPGSRRLVEIDQEELAAVLRPKLHGAWNLHELTLGDPLDFFVCFSSASSLLGADGQAHYAAANSWLDGLMAWRRARGLPGLSVNWGRWGTGGMLTAEAHAHFAEVGLRPMNPAVAAETLGRVMTSGSTQIMVAAIDWSIFKPLYQARRPRPLLDKLDAIEPYEPASSKDEALPAGLLDRELQAAPAYKRRDILIEHIEREVARVTGILESRHLDRKAGFFDLGMDSLMAVSLRSRLQSQLGRQLPKTIAFEHSTVDSLADFILASMYAPAVSAVPTPPHQPRSQNSGTEEDDAQPAQPIAIIGAGCRLPGSVVDLASFWRLLQGGVDAITEVPPDRWDIDAWYSSDPDAPDKMYTRHGGFVDGVDRFDAQFFGIAPREAAVMDPQHRMLLEVAWEAIENAGCSPGSLKGSRTGVFVGATTSDYSEILAQNSAPDAYYITGNSLNAAAGRLSYLLGLHGPSMVVDAACASSLVAVHLACRSLRSGESQMALAGGVNLILSPRGSVAACRSKMLSPTGRCRTFDASADGFVRGEGCGVVVLKRLSDAIADGDPILAVIRGSAVGQDGASGGLTVPNAAAQQQVIQRALDDAGVRPADVDCIEAHGTGTSLGDPIEIRAIEAVFGKHERTQPLLLGSVKTNIGHIESASGVAGLLKAVLSLKHGQVPAHLHLQTLNPAINLEAIPAAVPCSLSPWSANGRPRLVGVSSFGASGTLAHVVVEEAPHAHVEANGTDRPRHVLTLSARSERALRELAGRVQQQVGSREQLQVADVCFTLNAGRSHFEHRWAATCASRKDLIENLAACSQATKGAGSHSGIVERSVSPKVAFALDLHTALDWESLRKLHETSQTFRTAVEECDQCLREHGLSILEQLRVASSYAPPEPTVALAVQCSIARLWRSWGVQPATIWERGGPTLAAACVAGECGLEQGLKHVAGKSNGQAPTRGDGRVEIVGGSSFSWPDLDLIVAMSSADWTGLLETLCRLYVRGANIDWRGVDRDYRRSKVELPAYPFQRQRCWADRQPMHASEPAPTSIAEADAGLAGRRLSVAGSEQTRYEVRLRSDRPAYLQDHRVRGRVVLPATAYIEMALNCGAHQFGPTMAIEAMAFERPLLLADSVPCTVQTVLTPEGDQRSAFAIYARSGEGSSNDSWVKHAFGTLAPVSQRDGSVPALDALRRDCCKPLRLDAFYRELAARGLEFGEAFRGIESLWNGQAGALGHIRLAPGCAAESGSCRMHPALFDACSQVVAAALTPAAGSSDLYMLVGLERLVCHEPAGTEVWCYARPSQINRAGPDCYCADLAIYDTRGGLIATATRLTYQRIAVDAIVTVLGGNGNGHAKAAGNGHTSGRLKDRLEAATRSDRLGLIEAHVRHEVSRILGLPEWPDPRSGFFDLGMDSLSAFELVGALHRELGRSFPATVLFERSNAGALARYIQEEVLAGPANGNGHGNGNAHGSGNGHAVGHTSQCQNVPGREELDGLSTDEMAGLFAKMLSEIKGPTS